MLYSKCISTSGKLEKYAGHGWNRSYNLWDTEHCMGTFFKLARCGYTLRVTSCMHKHHIHLSIHITSTQKKLMTFIIISDELTLLNVIILLYIILFLLTVYIVQYTSAEAQKSRRRTFRKWTANFAGHWLLMRTLRVTQ